MKLQEFVKETLVQIVQGVQAAQEACADSDAKINPHNLRFRGTGSGSSGLVSGTLTARPATNIDFDVAVTVSEGTSKGGGAGLHVGVFNLGGQGQTEAASSTISRIKFTVPVFLPQRPVEDTGDPEASKPETTR